MDKRILETILADQAEELAAKKTGCSDLLLLTDHRYGDIEQDGYNIAVRQAYEYLLTD